MQHAFLLTLNMQDKLLAHRYTRSAINELGTPANIHLTILTATNKLLQRS